MDRGLFLSEILQQIFWKSFISVPLCNIPAVNFPWGIHYIIGCGSTQFIFASWESKHNSWFMYKLYQEQVIWVQTAYCIKEYWAVQLQGVTFSFKNGEQVWERLLSFPQYVREWNTASPEGEASVKPRQWKIKMYISKHAIYMQTSVMPIPKMLIKATSQQELALQRVIYWGADGDIF